MKSIFDVIFPWDKEVGGGAGGIRVRAPIFEQSFAVHDAHYEDLRAGTSTKTLAQIDREFLRNMLRQAWSLPELWQRVKWTRRAWLYYRAARAWSKLVRYQLDDYLDG